MSRSSFVPHVARRWVWFGGYALLVLGIGFFTNAWRRPLNSDEANYYFPAIHFFHQRLPSLPLGDYPFPGPPLALVVQALIFALVKGSVAGLRVLFSTIAALVAGLMLLRNGEENAVADKARRLGALVVLTFPYFLWNTFTLKHHTFSAALMMGALALWRSALKRDRWLAWIAPSALLCAAMATTQLCAPLCAALVLTAWYEARGSGPWNWKSMIAPAVAGGIPILVLGCFILLWKGVEPPMWRSQLLEGEVAGFRFNGAQCMLGLISMGAWVAPGVLRGRRTWLFVAVAAIPCAWLIHQYGLYAHPEDFWHTGMGPVSLILRKAVSVSGIAGTIIAGLLAAMGLTAWLQPGFNEVWNFFARFYVAIFLAVMCLTIPYLFESYYLLLLIPLLWLAGFARRSPPDRWGLAFMVAQCLAGTGYAVFKLLTDT